MLNLFLLYARRALEDGSGGLEKELYDTLDEIIRYIEGHDSKFLTGVDPDLLSAMKALFEALPTGEMSTKA